MDNFQITRPFLVVGNGAIENCGDCFIGDQLSVDFDNGNIHGRLIFCFI
jgi:hypothetical protein